MYADDTEVITLNVNPQSSIAFTGANTLLLNQSVCGGTDIQEIQYTIGGGATDITVNFHQVGFYKGCKCES